MSKILDTQKIIDQLVESTIKGLDKGYKQKPETYIVDARNSLSYAKKHLIDYVEALDIQRDTASDIEDFADPIVSKESALYAVSVIDDMKLELM